MLSYPLVKLLQAICFFVCSLSCSCNYGKFRIDIISFRERIFGLSWLKGQKGAAAVATAMTREKTKRPTTTVKFICKCECEHTHSLTHLKKTSFLILLIKLTQSEEMYTAIHTYCIVNIEYMCAKHKWFYVNSARHTKKFSTLLERWLHAAVYIKFAISLSLSPIRNKCDKKYV